MVNAWVLALQQMSLKQKTIIIMIFFKKSKLFALIYKKLHRKSFRFFFSNVNAPFFRDFGVAKILKNFSWIQHLNIR